MNKGNIATSRLEEKINTLKGILKEMGSVVVAYPGGTSSSFLLRLAVDVLGVKTLAITAKSPLFPLQQIKDTKKFARAIKCKHKIINFNCLDLREFKSNPVGRCYICNKKLFTVFLYLKDRYKYDCLIEGALLGDKNSMHPGLKALKELGIRSPLAEARLTSTDIRQYSKTSGLPEWDMPPPVCLASRIPYGEELTEAKLKIIEETESFISLLGLKQVKVKYHYPIARIVVPDGILPDIIKSGIREKIIVQLKKIGFEYITVDLENYRQGV